MPIAIPQFAAKADMLRDKFPIRELLARALVHDGNRRGMDGAALSRHIASDQLPTRYAACLLAQYGLRVPLPLDRDVTYHSHWFDLLAEKNVAAFAARVRLAGGAVDANPPGSTWDSFCSGKLAEEALVNGLLGVKVHRFDAPRPERLALFGAQRALPPGHPDEALAATARPLQALVLNAGERVAFGFDFGTLLQPRPQLFHVFCFYDVRVGQKRWVIPLLPTAAGVKVDMPEPCTSQTLFDIPHHPSATNCLVVDSGWDERALVAVVTERQLDNELQQAAREGEMWLEHLDLLAARLQDCSRWPANSWALLRLPYHVVPRGELRALA